MDEEKKYATLYLHNLIFIVEFETHKMNILNLKKKINWKNYQGKALLIARASKIFSKL